jgi:hypothetical protein
MPLAFNTLSHGTVSFGFFNIETDMLLLENHFFFADRFAGAVEALASAGGRDFSASWECYVIEKKEQVGDLTGAIHGIRHTGFLGALYRRFPFPSSPEAFRQKSKGRAEPNVVIEILGPFSKKSSMTLETNRQGTVAAIGPYLFERSAFQELILYVWRGGYPTWGEGERPLYVLRMKDAVKACGRGILEGISFYGE